MCVAGPTTRFEDPGAGLRAVNRAGQSRHQSHDLPELRRLTRGLLAPDHLPDGFPSRRLEDRLAVELRAPATESAHERSPPRHDRGHRQARRQAIQRLEPSPFHPTARVEGPEEDFQLEGKVANNNQGWRPGPGTDTPFGGLTPRPGSPLSSDRSSSCRSTTRGGRPTRGIRNNKSLASGRSRASLAGGSGWRTRSLPGSRSGRRNRGCK